MAQLLIYYSPLKENFYCKIIGYSEYTVGFTNSFGHILVQFFDIEEDKLVLCLSNVNAYELKRAKIELMKQVKTYKSPRNRLIRFIKKIITYLEK